MSSERYGDTDLVFWLGRSINAMTREELQVALGEAIMQIEHQKRKNIMLQYMLNSRYGKFVDETHSRFTNPEYIASFC